MSDETYDLVGVPEGDENSHTSYGDSPYGEGPIYHDLNCKHCGYNLRGLNVDRVCPECGTPVGKSVLGDQLRFSDPSWVRNIAKGVNVILWSVVAGILLGVFSVVVSMVVLGSSGGASTGLMTVFEMLTALPALIYVVGVWLITEPEPSVIEPGSWPLRVVLRYAVIVSTAIAILGMGVSLFVPEAIGVFDIVSGVLGLVGQILIFIYARRLALRVPDYGLAKQTKIVMWGVIISLLSILLFGIIAGIVAAIGSGSTGAVIVGLPICVSAATYLVFSIWSLVLLIRYRRVAAEAADDADNTWVLDLPNQPAASG